MYILYNNDNNEQKYNIKAYSISGNIITIQYGDDTTFPENTNGFKIFDNNTLMEDCSKFTTKYNTSDIGYAIMYSNDGSTETEENKLDVYYENYSFEDSMKEIFKSNCNRWFLRVGKFNKIRYYEGFGLHTTFRRYYSHIYKS